MLNFVLSIKYVFISNKIMNFVSYEEKYLIITDCLLNTEKYINTVKSPQYFKKLLKKEIQNERIFF